MSASPPGRCGTCPCWLRQAASHDLGTCKLIPPIVLSTPPWQALPTMSAKDWCYQHPDNRELL